jgi:5-methylcytosine-specific restriction endonuclease McrA
LLGLAKFFEGVPCKRGHISQRRTSGKNCTSCQKIWREDNIERVKIKSKQWISENRDKINAWCKEYRLENIDRIKKVRKAWRIRNPDRVMENSRNNQSRRRGAQGRHTRIEISDLHKKQKYKCAGCLSSIKDKFEVDHIIPISKGGSNWIANIQLLCRTCNRDKGALYPNDWAKSKWRLL